MNEIITTHETITAGGRERTFTVTAPSTAGPGRALVLVFHGSKQTGDIQRDFTGRALDPLVADGSAAVAYLDGYRRNWNDSRADSRFPARLAKVDDVAFARAVAARLVETQRVDARRVVAMGFSNGGQMVLRLLHEASDLISGGVIVGATMPNREGFAGVFDDRAASARGRSHGDAAGIPVALVASTTDPIVPYAGGRMKWWARTAFKIDGIALSAPDTATYFARRNGMSGDGITTPVPSRAAGDRAPMQRLGFRETGHAPVTLFTVEGGGHTVPTPTPARGLTAFVIGRTGTAIGIAEIVREVLVDADALRG
ncbi:polyhydroxybutyrate depolymerase [Schumannella luteola]|uniref:Polyhydroxybutyrate depolymerase n=1 Tax=Schumannella luteola TaxID=472059 RepID=A0A852YAC3_9MICO|nr:prolyl oligopeptidase family serine peptidase [Schumannella luteola]NYG98151.1 polyhydroxybutyrate depolymerase [Schumannella luteola]